MLLTCSFRNLFITGVLPTAKSWPKGSSIVREPDFCPFHFHGAEIPSLCMPADFVNAGSTKTRAMRGRVAYMIGNKAGLPLRRGSSTIDLELVLHGVPDIVPGPATLQLLQGLDLTRITHVLLQRLLRPLRQRLQECTLSAITSDAQESEAPCYSHLSLMSSLWLLRMCCSGAYGSHSVMHQKRIRNGAQHIPECSPRRARTGSKRHAPPLAM